MGLERAILQDAPALWRASRRTDLSRETFCLTRQVIFRSFYPLTRIYDLTLSSRRLVRKCGSIEAAFSDVGIDK